MSVSPGVRQLVENWGSTVQIYRIQRIDTKEGPYRDNSPIPFDCGMADSQHPMPSTDGIDMYSFINPRFGFLNCKQLKQWFADTMKYLCGKGYEIAIYCVPSGVIQIGQHQVAFEKDKAELKKEIPI